MSSKGYGQFGYKNTRGFQVPNTFFQYVKQPLMSSYTSCVEKRMEKLKLSVKFGKRTLQIKSKCGDHGIRFKNQSTQ
jgi:hypothetical protein